LTKTAIPYCEKDQYPIDEKRKENNTSINNTRYNNVATAPAKKENKCNKKPKQANACASSRAREFRAPTADDVREWATQWAEKKGKDVRSVLDVAEQARIYYERLDWKDSRGNKVKAWKQKIAAVWFTDEKLNNSKPKQQDQGMKF